MRDHFDTLAWLAGCGAWVVSTLFTFAAISIFSLNPLWLVLPLPVPAIVVAGLYAYRLKSLPKLARQLGNLNKDERQKAFKQLMAMGKARSRCFPASPHGTSQKRRGCRLGWGSSEYFGC